MKKYIYKITNLINNKVYIGQSIDYNKRFNEHCVKESNSLIHRAIKFYNKENFKVEELDYCENYNEREKYFIQYYNCMFPNGYNLTPGGEEPPIFKGSLNPMSKINEETAYKIQCLLRDEKYLTRSEIAKMFDATPDILRHINDGSSWYNKEFNYPIRAWRANVIQEEDIDLIIDLLLNSNLTQKEIALQIGVKRSAITMINIGQNHRRPDVQYPIRNKRVNKNL